MMHPRARPLVMTALIAAGAVAVTTALTSLSFFLFFELKGLDLLFTLRGARTPPAEVVVVAIDEPSFAELDRQWPWPRGLHARLLDSLREAGAKAVGFDILFAEPSAPAEDQQFAASLARAGNVVLAGELSLIDDPLYRHSGLIDPIPLLAGAAARTGIPLLSTDADGTVRRAPLAVGGMPSFAAQLVATYLGHDAAAHARGDERLIDFLGPPRTLRTVSYYQALDCQKLLPPGVFAGKIVLVGRSVQPSPEPRGLASDTFLTPFSLVARTATAGVEIQATLVANLLAGHLITEPAAWQKVFILLLLVVPASLPFGRLRPLAALGSAVVLALGMVGLAWLVFARFGFWLPVFSMVLALALSYVGQLVMRSIVAERERVRLLEAHNRELTQEVARQTRDLTSANAELTRQQAELAQRHQELTQAYEALTLAQTQLVQSEKMASLGFLVAGVAHELNNPISFVHGNLDFIDDYTKHLGTIVRAYAEPETADEGRRQGDAQREALHFEQTLARLDDLIRSCKDGADRVRKIVLDLRTFSRTDDSGLMEADLEAGLESSLNLLSNQYRYRIQVHRNYADLPLVLCHPGQINQVFMNLLQNAVQAISGQGNIWISSRLLGERVRICIRDDGSGIEPDHLPRVFDPFFTTKPVGSGTGLGLSISYRIVANHGGMLEVASHPGEWTEFTLELPVRTQ